MSKRTPAQQIQDLINKTRQKAKEKGNYEAKAKDLGYELNGIHNQIYAIVQKEAGIKVDDLVIDDMGVIYRVTDVRFDIPSYRYAASGEVEGTSLGKLLESARVSGIPLTKEGLPRWTKERNIRGKLTKYEGV